MIVANSTIIAFLGYVLPDCEPTDAATWESFEALQRATGHACVPWDSAGEALNWAVGV